MDPLSSLPKYQHRAVDDCKKQLEWLLTDEICSAMRQVSPVTSTTLDMVAAHVKGSNEKPKCIHNEIPLQFVYGPEQSMVHFNEVNLIMTFILDVGTI